jgi:hypothetical protein
MLGLVDTSAYKTSMRKEGITSRYYLEQTPLGNWGVWQKGPQCVSLSGLTPPDIKKKEFFNQKPVIK